MLLSALRKFHIKISIAPPGRDHDTSHHEGQHQLELDRPRGQLGDGLHTHLEGLLPGEADQDRQGGDDTAQPSVIR